MQLAWRLSVVLAAPLATSASEIVSARPTKDEMACLTPQPEGCFKIRDPVTCLRSVDGSGQQEVSGFKVHGEPCVWCGDQKCRENSDYLCEPLNYVANFEGGPSQDEFHKYPGKEFRTAACDQHGNPKPLFWGLPGARTTEVPFWKPFAPTDEAMSCLDWHQQGCSAISERDKCLGSRDGRPEKRKDNLLIHGQACVWCGGGLCTSANMNKCEPFDWLFYGEGKAFTTFHARGTFVVATCAGGRISLPNENYGCLEEASQGCHEINDGSTCLKSKDASGIETKGGFKVDGQPCVWCDGGICRSPGNAKCMPFDLLMNGEGKAFETFLATGSHQVASCAGPPGADRVPDVTTTAADDCFKHCGGGGSCEFCGAGKACCRKGWDADPPACKADGIAFAHSGRHECVLTPTTDSERSEEPDKPCPKYFEERNCPDSRCTWSGTSCEDVAETNCYFLPLPCEQIWDYTPFAFLLLMACCIPIVICFLCRGKKKGTGKKRSDQELLEDDDDSHHEYEDKMQTPLMAPEPSTPDGKARTLAVNVPQSAQVVDFNGQYIDSIGGVNTLVQNGTNVTATNPMQPWSPATGNVSGNSISMFGITGVMMSDCIQWSNGAIWQAQAAGMDLQSIIATAAFNAMDVNHDGIVSQGEFGRAMQPAPIAMQPIRQSTPQYAVPQLQPIQPMMQLSEPIQATMQQVPQYGQAQQEVPTQTLGLHPDLAGRALFDLLDKNKDGVITRSEFDQPVSAVVASAIPAPGQAPTPAAAAAAALFDLTDRNRDGVISRSEFNQPVGQVIQRHLNMHRAS